MSVVCTKKSGYYAFVEALPHNTCTRVRLYTPLVSQGVLDAAGASAATVTDRQHTRSVCTTDACSRYQPVVSVKITPNTPRCLCADPRVSSQINGPPFSICACRLATGGSHIHSSNGVLYMVFKGAAYVSCLKQQCINDLHLKFEKHKNELDSRRSVLSSLDGYKKWVQVLEGDFSNSEASKLAKGHQ